MAKKKDENKRIIAIHTRFKTTNQQETILDEICHAYNYYSRKYFANTCSKNPLDEKAFRHKYQLMDRRYSRSAQEDVTALRAAIVEKRNTAIQELKSSIKKIENNIKQVKKILENNKKINKMKKTLIVKKFIKKKLRKIDKLFLIKLNVLIN